MQLTASTSEAIAAPSARIGRRFALLWLAVAMLFQGLVIQTHAHVGADSYSPAIGAVRGVAVAVDGRRDVPVAPACPLCEEKALFGAYLLGGSATVAAPALAAYHYVSASLPLLRLAASSHAWQSRAPPLFTL